MRERGRSAGIGMSTSIWTPGVSGDWNTAADWSGGVPTPTSTATIAGPGSFLVTLFGVGFASNVNLQAAGADFYIVGTLALGGTLSLQAGTFTLAGGILAGGTLSMQGGQFLTNRGIFSGVAVQGVLDLGTANSALFVQNGLNLSGAGGSGNGSISLTGNYATLDFVGTQTLDHATISIGAGNGQAGQGGPATLGVSQAFFGNSAATLTLGASLWLRGVGGTGVISIGNAAPGAGPGVPDVLVNNGTITAASQGEILSITGAGQFTNQGTIGVSNGATLQIATAAFSNTGTIAVSNAVLSLGGTYTTAELTNLGSVSLSNGQIQLAGTAQNAGTLSIGSGSAIARQLGTLSLTGTIQGGTVADGGGGLSFGAGTGVLDALTYLGGLSLGAGGTLTLADGTIVAGAGGSAGSISVTGSGSTLLLRGSETLDRVTIALGSAGSAAGIATTDPFLASTATTATLGAHAFIVQGGSNASLAALGWSPVPGVGLADTLVNQGTITAAIAGGQFTVGGYGTVLNQGTIMVSGGDTLRVTVQNFTNTGTITASTGGTVLLGQPANWLGVAPSWTNGGKLAVGGGTLVLGGAFSLGQLGNVQVSSGSVVVAGTLGLAGGTLALGGAQGGLALPGLSLTGTIVGGTIVDAQAALAVGSGGTALLDGVSYLGTLSIGAGGFLRVRNGLALTGAVSLLSAGAVLDFQGSQSFDRAQILLGASGQSAAIDVAHDAAQSGGTTLTLGANATVIQSGQLAAIGRGAGGTGQAGDMIVNRGTITASVAGGMLTLGGPGFTNAGYINVGAGDVLAVTASSFVNAGSININAGTLAVATSLSLAQLGQVNLTAGVISIGGTLNLGGGTLTVGQGTSIGRVQLSGTISNGTIVDTGGGLSPSGAATLNAVTYDGILDLSRPFTQLSVSGGIALASSTGARPGEILLTGAQTRLVATGSETFDNVQIFLGSPSQYYQGQKLAAPELAAGAGVRLTLGRAATLTLAGACGTLGDAALGQWGDSLVNLGLINAVSVGTLSVGASSFTNLGTLMASGGGVLAIGDTGFTNAGILSAGAGSAIQFTLFNAYAAPNAGAFPLINTGTIALSGGVLQEVTANGLFPSIPIQNQAGATIGGAGLLFAPVANSGTIDASGGLLYLAQTVSGGGLMQIEQGATLEIGAVPSSEMVRFASTAGTLKLDNPAGFSGTLANMGAGDTIDLPGQILTGVGLNSGTIVLSTATQNYRLSGTTPFAGELSSGHDARGGATVSLTPQTAGGTGGGSSTPAVIAVGQPNMLFWASPAGDIFTGSSATLNGAHISNWGAADSIDLTDMLPTQAHLVLSQGPAGTSLAISDGVHAASIGLAGTFASSSFHFSADGHGGTLLTFGH